MIKVLLTLFLFCDIALSFTLNNSVGARFENLPIKINVENSNGACSEISLSNTEILDLATLAVDRFWNTVPTSRLRLERGSLVNLGTAFRTGTMCSSGSGSDGTCTINSAMVVPNDILISCNTNAANFGSTSVLAAAVPNNISGKNIVGALIVLNDAAGSRFDDRSREEQISVLAHEIGHAVGLGHSNSVNNLMYFESKENRSYLGKDDVYGVSWLYPQKQPLAVSCGTIKTEDEKSGPILLSFLLGLLSLTLFSFFKFKRKN